MGAGWGGQVDGGKGQELRYCIARSGSRLGYTIGFLERTVARVLVFLAATTLRLLGYTVNNNVPFGQTRPDESYKRGNDSAAPSAPASAGGSHAGRGPGEGPNLIALGATIHRCALAA